MEHLTSSALSPRDEGRKKDCLLFLMLTGKELGGAHCFMSFMSLCAPLAAGRPRFLSSFFFGRPPTGTVHMLHPLGSCLCHSKSFRLRKYTFPSLAAFFDFVRTVLHFSQNRLGWMLVESPLISMCKVAIKSSL